MFTYCPHCFSIFQVTPEQLEKAAGQARCSECGQVYRAADFLFDDLDTARASLVAQRDAPAAPADSGSRYASSPLADRTQVRPVAGWQHRTVSTSDIGSGLAVGLLVVLLGLQWVFFNRDALAADTAWRPTLERFCGVLHCTLPLRVDLARFGIVERDVRKHPVVEDALLINVAFENHARFVQPYPLFEVRFTDKAGKPVAMRYFTPDEYLGPETDPGAGMPPQTPVQVVLEVVDPGPEAVSFQFGFL